MKLFKPTTNLLVFLLAAMVIGPMVSVAPDKIFSEKIKPYANFMSVEHF